jgi:hypothetical protein
MGGLNRSTQHFILAGKDGVRGRNRDFIEENRWKRGESLKGDPEFAAISAVLLRHNDISSVLTTAPDRFELMHRRKPNGDVDPLPWCQGFYAAMRLGISAWAPLLDASNVNHGVATPRRITAAPL